MKHSFEQHIKQSLENFEAEYNPADWTDMQNKLNKAKIGKPNGSGKALMIAAAIAVVGGLIYYFSVPEEQKITTDPINAQQVVVTDKNTVQTVEVEDQEQTGTNQSPVTNSDSPKEQAPIAHNPVEEKSVSPEKTEVKEVVNTDAGNKAGSIQEQPKESVAAEVSSPVQSLPVSSFRASFRSDANKVCEGTAVKFTADNNDVPCTYKWSFGDGTYSSEQNPSHAYAEAGTYTVKLHVVAAKDRKQADQKSTVTVAAAPAIQMNYLVSEDNGLLINFEADADKISEWKWNFGDKQTSSVQNPSHTYSKKGNYKVEVTAKNTAGCSAVVAKEVNLKSSFNLLAPNAFSPDGNGVNDTWLPVALLNGDYTFTLTISDKTGNIVFKTSDKNHPWEGQDAKTGETYVWRAIVKDKNGDEIPCQGLITISE